jgi:hypothetical protein
MSDVTLPQCNNCHAVNTTKAQNWIRIFGVTLGTSQMPIQPRNWIDFCPACAATVTIDKLPAAAIAKA